MKFEIDYKIKGTISQNSQMRMTVVKKYMYNEFYINYKYFIIIIKMSTKHVYTIGNRLINFSSSQVERRSSESKREIS